MRSCKEIVQSLSQEVEGTRASSWGQRMEVKIHLLMCKHCARYAAQLEIIRDSFKKLFTQITKVDPAQVAELENESIRLVSKKANPAPNS